MMELCHTNCLKRDVEFKVLLEEFSVDIAEDVDQVIVEGILFLPIHKVCRMIKFILTKHYELFMMHLAKQYYFHMQL